MNEFEIYNKISDDVYIIGKNIILRMNVVLYNTTTNSNKIYFHREVNYFDNKANQEMRSIKRSFDYHLSIENIKYTDQGYKEFIRIGLPEVMLLKNSLSQVISWFNSPEYSDLYTLKGTELVLAKKPPKLVITPLPQNKFIAFSPVVIEYGADHIQGVRMYLNSEINYADITVPRFMGFIQSIIDINMYNAAQNMLNYYGRPPFGTNMYTMTNQVITESSERDISAPPRKITPKSNKSVFSELE